MGARFGSVEGCLACDPAAGRHPLPGGVVLETPHWRVEHCVGPLGVGTLLAKPRRHCTQLADLLDEEATPLGLLLRAVAACVRALCDADQTYVCLWSHAGWEPGHVHFVVQPARDDSRERHAAPGPTLQAEMFRAGVAPDPAAVEAFCERARAWPGWSSVAGGRLGP